MRKHSSGFSLVGIIVVIVISTALLLGVSSILSTYNRVSSAKRINDDAKVLLTAMNHFYKIHCTDPTFPVVTVNELISDGILSGGKFHNPWGGDFVLSIDRSIPRNPRLVVSAAFKTTEQAKFVADFSQNAVAVGGTVTWSINGSLSHDASGVERQMDRQLFGASLC
ncbi:hypothetical protein ACE02P_18070 [Shewanella bicestrii]|jgi:type II secretory pathway pseudopilin PulG